MKLTDNERALIARLNESEYTRGGCWVECLETDSTLPFGREGLGGVMASLSKKGLVVTYDNDGAQWAELTDAGLKAAGPSTTWETT